MADEQAPEQANNPAPEAKPAAKPAGKPAAKKEKPPQVEDKPFNEFMEQHYVPSLKQALVDKGVKDLSLTFAQQTFKPVGESCWQVKGSWANGQRQFIVAFPEENIGGKKAFACADGGAEPSYVEPFLGDERKMTLDLMVFGVVQRLNGQKWLGLN